MSERNRLTRLAAILAILLLSAAARTYAQDAGTDAAATDTTATTTDDASQGDLLEAQTAIMLTPEQQPEKFVPAAADVRTFEGATIVLRGDATVSGNAILVKNVCRWTQRDAAMFTQVADLTVVRIPDGRMYATVTLRQLRDTLEGAGINLALVSFNGATKCAVNRCDDAVIEQTALQQWSNPPQAIEASATQPPVNQSPRPDAADAGPLRSLRSLLAADLCARLGLDPNSVELSFNSTDDKILNLAEPYFQFQITPRQVRTLGDVSWDVTIAANGQKQKASINALARVWLTETIMARPVGYQQRIEANDVDEKRILVNHLTNQTLLTRSQAVGQSAARELKPGTILSADMVAPVLLARQGELITVTINQGSVQITAVAKALEPGSLGQTIRARGDVDATKLFDVTLTGPQQGTVVGIPESPHSSPL